jgi:hypothetical protein
MLRDPLLRLMRGSLTAGGSLCRSANSVICKALVQLLAGGVLYASLGLLTYHAACDTSYTSDDGVRQNYRLV